MYFTRGEKTASVMEHQLTNLERKIDDLLASMDDADADGASHLAPSPGDRASKGETKGENS